MQTGRRPISRRSSIGRPRSVRACSSTRPRRSRSSRWRPSSIGSTTSSPLPTSTCSARGASRSWSAGRTAWPPVAARCQLAVGGPPYGRYFGGPLTLAPEARRLDVSLAWLPWVGAVESLALLDSWAPTGAFEATLGLARDLAERLGIPWGGASLVCAPIGDPDGASAALRDAGIRAASRGSAIRCSAHVYTTRDDIDRAARRHRAVPDPLTPGTTMEEAA